MMLRMHSKQNKNIGFTLIELLIVIVIIGLLMSLVAPAMFSKVDSSKINTAKAQMEMFKTALDTYRLDMGDYPQELESLRNSEEENWDGPYLPKSLPKDPWGNDYVYQKQTSGQEPFIMYSYGKDGKEGGDEDAADIYYQH